MFCPKCGSQCADGAQFCPACGAAFQAPAQPAQPTGYQPAQSAGYQPTQPAGYQPAGYQPTGYQPAPVRPAQPRVRSVSPATAAQKTVAVIMALVAVFALYLGITNTFCMNELPMSLSADLEIPMSAMGLDLDDMDDYYDDYYDDYDDYYDYTESYDDYYGSSYASKTSENLEISGSIVVIDVSVGVLSELSDLLDTATNGQFEFSVGGAQAGMIIFGIINLLIAVFGVLYYIHIRTGNPLFFDFLKGKTPSLVIGAAGAVAALLQIILTLTAGISQEAGGMELAINLSVHWTTWVALGVYLAIAGYELLRLDKKDA